METYPKTAPIRRRLFDAVAPYETPGGSIVIPCNRRKKRHMHLWVMLTLLAGALWLTSVAQEPVARGVSAEAPGASVARIDAAGP